MYKLCRNALLGGYTDLHLVLLGLVSEQHNTIMERRFEAELKKVTKALEPPQDEPLRAPPPKKRKFNPYVFGSAPSVSSSKNIIGTFKGILAAEGEQSAEVQLLRREPLKWWARVCPTRHEALLGMKHLAFAYLPLQPSNTGSEQAISAITISLSDKDGNKNFDTVNMEVVLSKN